MSNNKQKITSRSEDFSQWYLDVIEAADLAEHSPVQGCMTVKPYGWAIWENMQKILDLEFKKKNVQNMAFPLLIPESFIYKEAEHVEGFAPELATVTQAGETKLSENYVIRPTSETIVYEAFSRWVKSYRDLPLLVNQWCNVMRWELRPRLFVRTREIWWQEGHTCHQTESEAQNFSKEMLEVYKVFQEEILATPVIAGEKTASEKFAGGLNTYTVEAMMQDGKAVQNATSHFLGTSFAGKFEVQFLDKDNQLKNPATTSWGCTTRMIGSLIMVHSDDLGLVLPPKIAPIQVVIVPVLLGQNNQKILDLSQKINTELLETCQSHLDSRDIRHGDKFYQWEKKGVPIRLELGPKDLENKQVTLVRRDTLAKETVSLENLNARILELLEQIQTNLFNCARDFRDQRMVEVDNWEDFAKEIESGKFVIASYDGTAKTEKQIKDKIKATTRCIPFDFKAEDIQEKCFFTGNKATTRAIFGKSY